MNTGRILLGGLLAGVFLNITEGVLNAVIRPRFGPGPMTGVKAGTAMWAIGYVVPSIWFAAMGLGLSAAMTTLALVWGLAEMALAGVIAGWMYREEGEAAAAPAEPTAPAAGAPPTGPPAP